MNSAASIAFWASCVALHAAWIASHAVSTASTLHVICLHNLLAVSVIQYDRTDAEVGLLLYKQNMFMSALRCTDALAELILMFS